MYEDCEKVIDAVRELSDILYHVNLDSNFRLSFKTDGYVQIVEFNGIELWTSEMDDREIDEDTDKPENFELFLKHKMLKVLEHFMMLHEEVRTGL